MAKDKEKKSAQLRQSILDARQERSLKLLGYGRSLEGIREAMLNNEQGEASWLGGAETDSERIAARENFLEQLFIRKAKAGNIWYVGLKIKTGVNVNAQDMFGMTALHYAAATGFRPCIRLLVNSGRCNYLIKDNKGRLASDLAYEWGRDYAVGLLLQKKEWKQAAENSLLPSDN